MDSWKLCGIHRIPERSSLAVSAVERGIPLKSCAVHLLAKATSSSDDGCWTISGRGVWRDVLHIFPNELLQYHNHSGVIRQIALECGYC